MSNVAQPATSVRGSITTYTTGLDEARGPPDIKHELTTSKASKKPVAKGPAKKQFLVPTTIPQKKVQFKIDKQPITSIKVPVKDLNKPTSADSGISGNSLADSFNHVIQSGYESKTSLQTEVVREYGQVPETLRFQPGKKLDYELINKFKTQYRSGNEVQAAVETLNGREKQELKEIKIPKKITPEFYRGNVAYSNANGFNGYQKIALQKASGGIIGGAF